jgi:hypothetical protein
MIHLGYSLSGRHIIMMGRFHRTRVPKDLFGGGTAHLLLRSLRKLPNVISNLVTLPCYGMIFGRRTQ